ncbi:MAG: DUF547 domain-containing protein [Hyphomicrobiaceae bacterium]
MSYERTAVLRLFCVACITGLIFGLPNIASASVTDIFAKYTRNSSVRIDHGTWDKLLKAYVSTDGTGLNRVDYAALKATGHRTLKAYLERLAAVEPDQLDRPEQFAFWANLYNAKTIDIVLDHYPVRSIRDIAISSDLLSIIKQSVGAGGPWKAKVLRVSGQELSLDDIEHGVLRPIFGDPRVHYAVNCASISCPNLRTTAFSGENLEAELEAGAREYINSPRGFSLGPHGVTASSIYSWFQDDFGDGDAGVLAHARSYASGRLKKALAGISTINGFDYDWGLNDVQQ